MTGWCVARLLRTQGETGPGRHRRRTKSRSSRQRAPRSCRSLQVALELFVQVFQVFPPSTCVPRVERKRECLCVLISYRCTDMCVFCSAFLRARPSLHTHQRRAPQSLFGTENILLPGSAPARGKNLAVVRSICTDTREVLSSGGFADPCSATFDRRATRSSPPVPRRVATACSGRFQSGFARRPLNPFFPTDRSCRALQSRAAS